MTINPYQAPGAAVADYTPPSSGGQFLGAPQKVEAGRGAAWFSVGWSLFKQAPGLWIVMFIIMMALMMVANFIPLLGMLLGSIAMPLLMAGMMAGADAAYRGQPVKIDHLFLGFSRNFGNLIIAGVIYAVAIIALMLVLFVPLFGMVGFSAMMSGGDPAAMPAFDPMLFLLVILIYLALLLPLMMAFWFAPALILLEDRSPIEAYKLSFFGCLKNLLPFLIYGVVGMLLAIVATIPLALGWLVLGPMIYTSAYAAFRDIYYAR